MKYVVVTTGSRLHFGLLAHGQSGSREFGGIGVMIDRPGFVVRAQSAPVDELLCGAWHERVAAVLARLRTSDTTDIFARPVRLEIQRAPPAHAGLGSGTQLGMALTRILLMLAREPEMSAVELARRAGRGLRSAVGLHGFQQGGLIVEAGHCQRGEISPLVARVDVPDRWRFVLARPAGATGLAGADEINGFARLPSMPQAVTDRLCRIALMEIVPAAVEHDFGQTAESIGQFGRLVGEYFAPVQGAVFADERMRALARVLKSRGIHGFGQSSWGPTIFILCPDAEFAVNLASQLKGDAAGADCEFTIAAPLNTGAMVQTADDVM
jgi:beta-RFAP synthase